MIDFISQQHRDKTKVLWRRCPPLIIRVAFAVLPFKAGLRYVSHMLVKGPFFQSNPLLTYLIDLMSILISGTKDGK